MLFGAFVLICSFATATKHCKLVTACLDLVGQELLEVLRLNRFGNYDRIPLSIPAYVPETETSKMQIMKFPKSHYPFAKSGL